MGLLPLPGRNPSRLRRRRGAVAVLMVGQPEQEELLYPVSELAARHGASVTTETSSGDEAYADWPGGTNRRASLAARRRV